MGSIGIEDFILIGSILLFVFISGLIIFIAIFQNQAVNREKKQEKLLSEAIIKSQENERKTIGEELHEDIAPVLVSALINLNSLAGKPKEILEENVEFAIQNVEFAIQKLRSISHQLHPAAIENFGLLFGLNDFSKVISNSKNVSLKVQSNFENIKLSSFEQIIVYRIIQELVINAIKHGSAKNIQLDLESDVTDLHISLNNDGENFDDIAYTNWIKNTDSLGLKIVQQNLNLLNGSIMFNVKLRSKISDILIRIPLH
jgi:signal transduction histidine kinase